MGVVLLVLVIAGIGVDVWSHQAANVETEKSENTTYLINQQVDSAPHESQIEPKNEFLEIKSLTN